MFSMVVGKLPLGGNVVVLAWVYFGYAASQNASDASEKCLRVDSEGGTMSCRSRGIASIPVFNETLPFKELNLESNNIAHLGKNDFRRLHFLQYLDLSFNKLTTLNADMFHGLVALKMLSLLGNIISTIASNTFDNLKNLTLLRLSSNKLTTLKADMFRGLFALEELILNNNNISTIQRETFKDLVQLKTLILASNELTTLKADVFRGLFALEKLYLSGNTISTIEPGTFMDLQNLNELYLSCNRLTIFTAAMLRGLVSLKSLYLDDRIVDRQFREEFGPIRVELRFKQKGEVHPLALLGPGQETTFYTDDWTVCCMMSGSRVGCIRTEYTGSVTWELDFFWTLRRAMWSGRTRGSLVSSCEDLMHNVSLRTFIWIIGLFSVLFNVVTILWRLFSPSRTLPQQKTNLLVICLAFADFCMGVYLLIIGTADQIYRGYYVLEDENWRFSSWCSLAGFFSTFSSEFSVLILTLITVDRYLAVVYGTRNCALSYLSVKIIVVGLFILSVLLAALPFMRSDLSNFYSLNGVCLPLPLTVASPEKYEFTYVEELSAKWTYSFSVFIGLNSVSVLIIIYCYARILYEAVKSKRQMRNTANNRESRLGRRIMLIVGTDMACWIPIIIFGFISASGYRLPGSVYAWTAVFVLPINSAINPMIYTFYTETFRNAITKRWSSVRIAFSTMYQNLVGLTGRPREHETVEMNCL